MGSLLMVLLVSAVAQEADTEKLEKVWAIKAGFGVQSLAISPDGKVVVAGGRDYGIILIDSSSGTVRRTFSPPKDGSKETVTGLGFTADPNLVDSGALDGMVRQWDVRTGRETKSHRLGPADSAQEDSGRTTDFVTSPDGKFGAAYLNEKIVVLKAPGLEESVRLAGHPAPSRGSAPHGLSFSRDGKKLASGGLDGTVKIWDLTIGKEVRAIQALRDRAYAVALSADGKLLASAGDNKTVKVWDVQSGKALMTGTHEFNVPHGFAFSLSGKTLLSTDSKTIKLWDVGSGKELSSLETEGGVDATAFSRDGTLFALANIPGASVSVYRWIPPKTSTEDKK